MAVLLPRWAVAEAEFALECEWAWARCFGEVHEQPEEERERELWLTPPWN